jgi:peptidoglycan hydrolase-like protein with peptidoglycan-binding domain
MRRFAVAACAFALAGTWMLAPAFAADTDKAAGQDKSTMDKVKDKASDTKDTIKEKASEATEKIKEKASAVKEKVTGKKQAKTQNADVRTAQQALKDKGFDPGPIDGVKGPRTTAAVKKYQQAEGMTASGNLDDETMNRLRAAGGTSSSGAKEKAPAASPATSDEKSQTKKPSE